MYSIPPPSPLHSASLVTSPSWVSQSKTGFCKHSNNNKNQLWSTGSGVHWVFLRLRNLIIFLPDVLVLWLGYIFILYFRFVLTSTPLSLSWRTLVYRKKHSWARDNSVATMWTCWKATKLLYLFWVKATPSKHWGLTIFRFYFGPWLVPEAILGTLSRCRRREDKKLSRAQLWKKIIQEVSKWINLLKSVRQSLCNQTQCCGSGMIYSRSGSSFEFSKFRIRIQAKVPDPCGSGSNPY